MTKFEEEFYDFIGYDLELSAVSRISEEDISDHFKDWQPPKKAVQLEEKSLKKKIFISNGLRGKSNPEVYVEKCRKVIDDYFNEDGYERLDTFFKDFDGNRVQFLGKSIMALGEADIAVFMDDWHNYDGCVVEHMVATRYGISVYYLSSEAEYSWVEDEEENE